jgi:hypothetical protein
VRKVAALIGVYVGSRVTTGVTVKDVAKAALDTPPITRKAEQLASAPVAGENRP